MPDVVCLRLVVDFARVGALLAEPREERMRRNISLRNTASLTLALLVAAPTVDAAEPRAPKASNIEIVVGSGAGATPDVFMRRVAKILNEEKIVTQPLVVQNRTGGGWTVASNYVLGKQGSEEHLFALVPTVFTTPIVQGRPNVYDKVSPIAVLLRFDLVVVVRPDSPYKTLADLVAAAKKMERSVQFAGANVGSTDHIVTALIEKAGGVKFNYVPFDGGGGPLMTAFLGGSVDAIVLALDEAQPLLRGNKVRAIALLSEQRRQEPEFKEVPTAKEQGLNVVWGSYYGIAGAPNLDPSVVSWWDDKLGRMAKTPAWQELLKENFIAAHYVGSDKVKPFLDQIYGNFLTVLRDVGLSKQ
jgi:putative tricarboxylic transport membrane protein